MWRWLFNGKHSIALMHRRQLFLLVKKMLYADNVNSLQMCYEELLNDSTAKQYPNYLHYIAKLFTRQNEWALCHRQHLPTRGHDTNNMCEQAMRIMKDYVLQRIKACNVVQVSRCFLNHCLKIVLCIIICSCQNL